MDIKLLYWIGISSCLVSCQTTPSNQLEMTDSMIKKVPKSEYIYPFASINFTTKGVKTLTKLAKNGDAKSASKLSSYYYFVRKNRKQGDFWQHRAAELGDSNAQFSIGSSMYDYPMNEQQRQEGIVWLKASAAQGNTYAKDELARINNSKK